MTPSDRNKYKKNIGTFSLKERKLSHEIFISAYTEETPLRFPHILKFVDSCGVISRGSQVILNSKEIINVFVYLWI